jgi:hypothetical protein
MSEQLKRTLLEVTEQTCEVLAFIFPVPPPDTVDDCAGPIARVQVGFSGPFDGTLALAMPEEMLPVLAGNILGLDPAETNAAQQQDASKELCNVICGNLLPIIAGTEPVFAVSTPRACGEHEVAQHAAIYVRSWLSEGWVEATLAVEEAACFLRPDEAAS